MQAIRDYYATRNSALVQPIVRGIVEKYLPEHLGNEPDAATRPLNAFGLESLTMMEVILDIQDALGLTILDDELRAMKNFDEVTALLSRKVAALGQSH